MGAFTSPHNIVLASVQTGLPTLALLTQLGAYCVKRLAQLAITCSYEETAPSSFSQRIGRLIQRRDVAFHMTKTKSTISSKFLHQCRMPHPLHDACRMCTQGVLIFHRQSKHGTSLLTRCKPQRARDEIS